VDFLFCDLCVDFYRRHLVHHEGFPFLSNGSFSPGSAFAVFIIAGAIAAIDSAAIIAMMANIVLTVHMILMAFKSYSLQKSKYKIWRQQKVLKYYE
jgi:hypothetical protein